MAFWNRKEEPRGERLDQVSPSTIGLPLKALFKGA